jgi:hypothetical protein
VIEGVFWHRPFNFFEHFFYLLAGLFFAGAAWITRRDGDLSEGASGNSRDI